MRHDGGDAETGFGVYIGGGLAFDVSTHTLVAHEASAFRERGLTLGFRQTLGASSTDGADALMGSVTLSGPRTNDNSDARRLELTAGYGVAMFDERFTGSPEIGVRLSYTGCECPPGWAARTRLKRRGVVRTRA